MQVQILTFPRMKKEPTIHAAGGSPLGDGRKSHVYGRMLEPGDILEPGDMYASSNGYFEPCPCPGLTLQAGTTHVLWVRPE